MPGQDGVIAQNVMASWRIEMDNVAFIDKLVNKLKRKLDMEYAAAKILKTDVASACEVRAKLSVTRDLSRDELEIIVSKTVGGKRVLFRRRQIMVMHIGLLDSRPERIVSRKYVEQVLLKGAVVKRLR